MKLVLSRGEKQSFNNAHKKPRKPVLSLVEASKKNPEPKLTKEQKSENRAISKKRIYVELVLSKVEVNAIGGMKRFQILVIRLRSKSDFIKDAVIHLAAGLFNLKNNFIIQ